jgi:hypothetical protein
MSIIQALQLCNDNIFGKSTSYNIWVLNACAKGMESFGLPCNLHINVCLHCQLELQWCVSIWIFKVSLTSCIVNSHLEQFGSPHWLKYLMNCWIYTNLHYMITNIYTRNLEFGLLQMVHIEQFMQCHYIGNDGNTLYPNLPNSFLEEVEVQFYIFILHKFKFLFDKLQEELECLVENVYYYLSCCLCRYVR